MVVDEIPKGGAVVSIATNRHAENQSRRWLFAFRFFGKVSSFVEQVVDLGRCNPPLCQFEPKIIFGHLLPCVHEGAGDVLGVRIDDEELLGIGTLGCNQFEESDLHCLHLSEIQSKRKGPRRKEPFSSLFAGLLRPDRPGLGTGKHGHD